MDSQKIMFLLSREEGAKLDFKVKLSFENESSKKEFAKDICAIANSRGGRGYILFGIEDKTKKIVGIDLNEFNEEKIQQVISTRIDPPVPISVDIVTLNGKNVGSVTIYNTGQKPHQMRETGAFYIRRGSTTDIMRKEEIASMLQDSGLVNYELMPVINSSINDLDIEKVLDYFAKSGLPGQMNNDLLMGTGIAYREKDYNELHPTCGGILLFGKHPDYFIPHAVIKIKNYNSVENSMPFSHISKGTIMDMLDDACSFLKDCIKQPDFPMDVIYDLTAKSVTYRDYFDLNSPIEITVTKDQIEIANAGAAPKGANNGADRYIRRNQWLYLKLLTIDKDKKYINKNINVNNLIKDYGRIKYYNITSRNLFKTIIPIRKKD